MKRLAFRILLLSNLLIMSNSSVSADIRLDVVNVESWDTLSVRSQPHPDSAKVGELVANQSCITFSGARKKYKNRDWLLIEHDGVQGWVNSKYLRVSSKACLESVNNDPFAIADSEFEDYLKKFLNAVFWGKNTDQLLYYSDPSLMRFKHPAINFVRFFNPGASCNPYGESQKYEYYFSDQYKGEINPRVSKYRIFRNSEPTGGFCEDSPSADGIYYKEVKTYPDYYDGDSGLQHQLTLPRPYVAQKTYKLIVLIDKFIRKTIYFSKIQGAWYPVIFDDCDCSA